MTVFLFVLAGILLLPAIIIAICPRGWVRATAGWLILGIGLLLIDDHVATASPYDDDGVVFGPGAFVGLFWVMLIGATIALFARWKAVLEPPDPSAGPTVLQWVRDWAIPLSLLIAAAGMHWLRNRLAGAEPAALIHFAIIGASVLICSIMLWRKRRQFGGWTTLEHFALALPASVALLIAWDVHKGFELWSRANEFAGDKPRCMMSYGGFEHAREAHSGWDLSPLINRRYGTWAASKASVVILREGDNIQRYRWFAGRWREVPNHGALPCQPRPSR